MTNDDSRRGEPGGGGAAAEPLDETDLALLVEVAAAARPRRPGARRPGGPDPFSLALDEVYAEVAAITRVPDDALAVRSDPSAGMRTETLTFAAERLTAMVTVTRRAATRCASTAGSLLRRRSRACSACRRAPRRSTPTTPAASSSRACRRVSPSSTFVPARDEAGTVVTPLFQL